MSGERRAAAGGVETRDLLADAKVDVVLRLLRGERLLSLAQESGVPPERLLGWRDAFLAAGHACLARPQDGEVQGPARPARLARRGRRSLFRRGHLALRLGGVAALLVLLSSVVAVSQTANIDHGWQVIYDGYGKVGVEETEDGEQVHYLLPMRPERPEETHAALKTTLKRYRDLELTLRVRAVRQLRQGSAPNPWETAWVIWHYQDDQHFYYLTLKPNGWEIGKRDPAYQGSQRFLASDKVPIYYFNTWYDIRVVQVGDTMAVWANGLPLARFTDDQSPYTKGRVGLYAEDAYAQFGDIHIESAGRSSLTDAPPSSTPFRG